jgi:hypothetical protein
LLQKVLGIVKAVVGVEVAGGLHAGMDVEEVAGMQRQGIGGEVAHDAAVDGNKGEVIGEVAVNLERTLEGVAPLDGGTGKADLVELLLGRPLAVEVSARSGVLGDTERHKEEHGGEGDMPAIQSVPQGEGRKRSHEGDHAAHDSAREEPRGMRIEYMRGYDADDIA